MPEDNEKCRPGRRALFRERLADIEGRKASELAKTQAQVRVRSYAASRTARDMAGGAGYPIDRELRRRMVDVSTIGLDPARNRPPPGEAFAALKRAPRRFFERHDAEGLWFATMRPERDHAFSIADFAETHAAGRLLSGSRVRLASLKEGVIHNYSPLDGRTDLQFKDDAGIRFAVAGFSLLREADAAHFLMLGESLPGEDGAARAGSGARVSIFGSHSIRDGVTTCGEVQVVDADGKQRCIYLRPGRDLWLGIADDICRMLMALPAYFGLRIVVQRGRVTPYGTTATEAVAPTTPRRTAEAAAAPARPRIFRIVSALAVRGGGESPENPSAWRREPEFQVDVDGFYRRIGEDSVGADPEGRPTLGRTWVHEHRRWRDKPERNELRVKASVVPAMALAGARAAGSEISHRP